MISEGLEGARGTSIRVTNLNEKQLTNICHPQSAEEAPNGLKDLVVRNKDVTLISLPFGVELSVHSAPTRFRNSSSTGSSFLMI